MINVKDQFPIFDKKIKGKKLTYLDSANSSQKPKSVIEKLGQFYSYEFANVGRGIYQLASSASEKYEETRDELKKFINCKDDGEIIFTKNSTESLNLIAQCFGEKYISEGDEIISTELEHHANYVPWHFLRKKKKAIIKFIPVDDDGNLQIEKLSEFLKYHIYNQIKSGADIVQIFDSWAGLLNKEDLEDLCYKPNLELVNFCTISAPDLI